jgi:hypothetical protein
MSKILEAEQKKKQNPYKGIHTLKRARKTFTVPIINKGVKE